MIECRGLLSAIPFLTPGDGVKGSFLTPRDGVKGSFLYLEEEHHEFVRKRFSETAGFYH